MQGRVYWTHSWRRDPLPLLRTPLTSPPRNPPAQSLALQMIGEATALGTVMAVWWRVTHSQEKAKYDKYYANLRASIEGSDE